MSVHEVACSLLCIGLLCGAGYHPNKSSLFKMDHSTHNKIVSFIWSIADDCLRDVFMRGKYRDFILPMFVLRRLDCLLEPSKFMMEMVGKMNPGQLCRQLIMKPVKNGASRAC